MSDKVKKSLHYSVIDGIFASVMLAINEIFIVPYAISMRASTSLIGVISSMPNLAAALFQMKSASFSEKLGSRKALITASILIHALMLIPIILIPYVFKAHQPVFLLIFYTICAAFNGLAFPAWSSMMSDLVSEKERGRFFGWRNMVTGLVYVTTMLLVGTILYYTKSAGFTYAFIAAFLSRMISWRYLHKMYEPPLTVKDEHRFTFLDFFKKIIRSNFGRFVIFVAATNFSVFIVSPFFVVYMLRDLGFNYLTFTIVTMSASLTLYISMKPWGIHADHVGNKRILKLTSFFIPIIPVLWLFSHNVVYLVLIQIFAGFMWSGFNLSASNFIYDAVTPQKRTRCIAYFNVINGVAIFAGAATGGLLSGILPPLFGYRILTLALLSGILRALAALLGFYFKEVRKAREISSIELFYSIIGLRPILAMHENKE